MPRVSAILLAAGMSQRMGGQNKLFLPVNGKAIVDTVIEKLLQSTADEIILVGSELSLARLSKWESDRVQVVDNPKYGTGMTSSIQAGVSVASSDAYMICLGDQPNIEMKTFNQLMVAFKESWSQNQHAIALPFYQGNKGNPVIFAAAYRQAILAHSRPDGCKEIVQAYQQQVTKVNVQDSGVLLDVDTREDYEKLSQRY